MSHVGAPRGRTCSRTFRSVALLTTGVLAVPALAACTSDNSGNHPAAADIAPAARSSLARGGTVDWAVDSVPATLNAFQADADSTTSRIAGAVLPSLFVLDDRGTPRMNPDYLASAKVVDREPKQVVEYKLNQQAEWSDGREIGAPDFVAQWHALSGKNSAFWTARNAGYDRIEKIQRGRNDFDVKVTFDKPYADWKSLFTPLYPKEVTGTPNAFDDGARAALKTSAGPFSVQAVDPKAKTTTLVRNPHWWGKQAQVDSIVLRAIPMDQRPAALAAGQVDVADIDTAAAERISAAQKDQGENGKKGAAGAKPAEGPGSAIKKAAPPALTGDALATYQKQQRALAGFTVRKSLAPAYTQLAMNGQTGPLSDDRVRRAVARALDRQKLADTVLGPLGLPAKPLGSHLAVQGQPAYADSSNAIGKHDTHEAKALLADAGWTQGGARTGQQDTTKAGGQGDKAVHGKDGGKTGEGAAGPKEGKGAPSTAPGHHASASPAAGGDDKPGDGRPDGVTGAYAPGGTAAPAASPSHGTPAGGPLGKDGKPLTLRFVLPSGQDSAQLRTVGDQIAKELHGIGVDTEITKVPDDSFFKDYIASGAYDLALYSWPASAYPATDGEPIYAKPQPAADGSLLVAQNYTRVGTDRIDQLFDQAAGELDQNKEDDLLKQADARIWAAAGSIPLYQRPQLVAVRNGLKNVGAFGLESIRYQDIGYAQGKVPADRTGKGDSGAASDQSSPSASPSATPSASGSSGDQGAAGDD